MSPPLAELQKILTDSPTGKVRANVAGRLAEGFSSGEFKPTEKQVAIEIFRLLVNDTEIMVRKMLSEQLSKSLDAPHDVILKLAKDVQEVSLPVLEHSYVLTEDDLIAITHSTEDVTVMSTIARRETVSRELSQALIEKSNTRVIETLLANKSASIDEKNLTRIYSNCNSNESIMDLMVKRGGLPVTLAEKIFSVVSDELKKVLTQQYKLSLQVAEDSTSAVREAATLGIADAELHAVEISKLVDQLYQQGKLTLSIIIRSLCRGDTRFFGYAMARLADVPYNNAQLLILDQGDTGFKSLYKTSCLPMELFNATRYLLLAVLEETGFGRYECSDIRQRLSGRLLQEDAVKKIPYMDYLYTLLQQHNKRELLAGAH